MSGLFCEQTQPCWKAPRRFGVGFAPSLESCQEPAHVSGAILLASQSQHPEWEKYVETCFHFSFQMCFLPGRAVQRLCRRLLCLYPTSGLTEAPLSQQCHAPVQSPRPQPLPLNALFPQDYTQALENSFVLYVYLYKTDTGGIY